MNIRAFCILIAGSAVSLACGQAMMTSRQCSVSYTYLYGGGPNTYGGGNTQQQSQVKPYGGLSMNTSKNDTGSYLGYTWSASLSVELESGFSVSGDVDNIRGMSLDGKTSVDVTAGGNIGVAQMFASNPGNRQEFVIELASAMEYVFRCNVSHNVPANQIPEVSLKRWNGTAWGTLASNLFNPGGSGYYLAEGLLNAGRYQVLGQLTANATANAGGTAAVSRRAQYQAELFLAPPDRAVVGTIELQSWLGPTASEAFSLELQPLQAGENLFIYGLTVDASGRYRVEIPPTIRPGQYTVEIKGRIWQSRIGLVSIQDAGDSDAGTLVLRAGDCDGNDIVDSDDFDLMVQAFGTSAGGSGYDARANLDGVNGIDSDDLEILAAHMGERGDGS